MTRGRRLARSAARVAVLPAALYAALCAFLYAKQDELLFLPDRRIVATPAKVGLAWEDVRIPSENGLTLAGWYVPAPAEPRATVLHCHGNGGNLTYLGGLISSLHERGLAVLVFDYRGYGQSDGEAADLSEAALYRDAGAAWSWLTEERGVDPSTIVLWGQSLGGGVCSWLAERHGGKALVLESTFTSVNDVAAAIYWFLPVRLLSRFDFATHERLPALTMPVLVGHAQDDEVVPYEHGRRNFDAIRSRKRFVELRGGHNAGFEASPEAMDAAVAFLLEDSP